MGLFVGISTSVTSKPTFQKGLKFDSKTKHIFIKSLTYSFKERFNFCQLSQ